MFTEVAVGGVVLLQVELDWLLGVVSLAVKMSGFSKERCLSTSTVAMAPLREKEKMCVSQTGARGG